MDIREQKQRTAVPTPLRAKDRSGGRIDNGNGGAELIVKFGRATILLDCIILIILVLFTKYN
jgi:hypothetical protein